MAQVLGWSRLPPCRDLPVNFKIADLQRVYWPALSYRCSRRPFGSVLHSLVGALQLSLISVILRLPRESHETDADYQRRRGRVSGRLAKAAGCWSLLAAARVISWHDHLRRGHQPSWATKVFLFGIVDGFSYRGWLLLRPVSLLAHSACESRQVGQECDLRTELDLPGRSLKQLELGSVLSSSASLASLFAVVSQCIAGDPAKFSLCPVFSFLPIDRWIIGGDERTKTKRNNIKKHQNKSIRTIF